MSVQLTECIAKEERHQVLIIINVLPGESSRDSVISRSNEIIRYGHIFVPYSSSRSGEISRPINREFFRGRCNSRALCQGRRLLIIPGGRWTRLRQGEAIAFLALLRKASRYLFIYFVRAWLARDLKDGLFDVAEWTAYPRRDADTIAVGV
jgi:hypothetical protein